MEPLSVSRPGAQAVFGRPVGSLPAWYGQASAPARATDPQSHIPPEMRTMGTINDVNEWPNSPVEGFAAARSAGDAVVETIEEGEADDKKFKKETWAVVCCVIVVAAVAISVVVGVSGGKDPEVFPTLAPTTAPTTVVVVESERLKSIREAIKRLEPDPAVLEDPSMPQYDALVWLADEDTANIGLENTKRLEARYVLATLYYSTNGNGWSQKHDFLSREHECRWTDDRRIDSDLNRSYVEDTWDFPIGVYCNDDDQVLSLNLENNGLVGSIPLSLSSLTTLRHLSLASNTGLVALDTFSAVTKFNGQLITLDLSDNLFDTTIPSNLSDLSMLESLDLSGNRLTSTLPTELALLTKLTSLDIDSNFLVGNLEGAVENLSNLEVLLAWDNDFSISPDLHFPSRLELLVLGRNKFASSPLTTNIGRLSNLSQLILRRMDLQGNLPTELAMMTALRRLDLSENPGLSGTFPWSSMHERTLVDLTAGECSLTGTLPSDIGRFTKMTHLDLATNLFEGSIPASIGDLTALEVLSMGNNFLTGSLPSTLGTMTSLQLLSMLNNELTGWLPAEMMSMTSLVGVSLYGNQFTGGSLEFICNRFNPFGRNVVECSNNITCSCCSCI